MRFNVKRFGPGGRAGRLTKDGSGNSQYDNQQF
jgi:hypothetical protein